VTAVTANTETEKEQPHSATLLTTHREQIKD